jgi:hypothetical protein
MRVGGEISEMDRVTWCFGRVGVVLGRSKRWADILSFRRRGRGLRRGARGRIKLVKLFRVSQVSLVHMAAGNTSGL